MPEQHVNICDEKTPFKIDILSLLNIFVTYALNQSDIQSLKHSLNHSINLKRKKNILNIEIPFWGPIKYIQLQ